MSSLFKKQCVFAYTQREIGQSPTSNLPQIAFIGRSNVGKSSLINALVRRKKLVRAAKTPGRTVTVNYFNLADELFLVDLPGFGYAKQSKSVANGISILVSRYLSNNIKLSLLIIIVDVRRKDEASIDSLVERTAKGNTNFLFVLNKIDKATTLETSTTKEYLEKSMKGIRNFHGVFPVSSKYNLGLDNLREFISHHCTTR